MIRRILRPVRPRVAAYFGQRLLARGTDMTAETTTRRALIARKAAAGTEVLIVIASDGRRSERALEIGEDELARIRRIEAVEAASTLGLPSSAVRFLDFEDGTLDEHRKQLGSAIAAIEAELRPDEIFAPQVDQHPDHRALSEVARGTLAGTGAAAYYEYPVRYWGRVPWVTRSPNRWRAVLEVLSDPVREWRRPPAALVATEGYRQAKHAALAVYAGEMESVGHFVYPYAELEYEAFFPVTR